jgi:hypothetical protein
MPAYRMVWKLPTIINGTLSPEHLVTSDRNNSSITSGTVGIP